MAQNIREAPGRTDALVPDFQEDYRKLFLLQGGGMFALGIAAAVLPHIVSLAIDVLIGWLLLIAGLFRFGAMAGTFDAPGYGGSLLLSGAMILFGTVLALFPSEGIPTLVMILAAYLLVDGFIQLVLGESLRPIFKNWLWCPVAALIDFSLTILVIFGWPARTGGLFGLYLGINFFFGGVALVFAALSLRVADGKSKCGA